MRHIASAELAPQIFDTHRAHQKNKKNTFVQLDYIIEHVFEFTNLSSQQSCIQKAHSNARNIHNNMNEQICDKMALTCDITNARNPSFKVVG